MTDYVQIILGKQHFDAVPETRKINTHCNGFHNFEWGNHWHRLRVLRYIAHTHSETI